MPFADVEPGTRSAHHLAVVVLPKRVHRDGVRSVLAERRIQTSVHYPPIHAFSHYRRLAHRRELPATDDVAARLVTLPLYPTMTEDDASFVASALLEAA